jgi:TetR/AcrR family transcriptional repressor of lmrAB and yxaGH operons
MPPGPRDRLVAATIDLVRERGVHGTGLADVLERSGTARASIYQHFPGGKGQLVAEAVRVAGDHLERVADRGLDAGASTRGAAMVEALLDWWSREITRHGGERGCPVAAAAVDADPLVRAAADGVFARLHRRLADEVGDAGLAGFVLSAVEGAVLRSRAAQDPAALEEARHQVRRLLA